MALLPRSRRKERPRAAIAAGAAAVLATAVGAWWHWLNAVPDVVCPPTSGPLPQPNGYDVLMRAAAEIADREIVGNAFIPDLSKNRLPRSRHGRPYTAAERAAAVAANGTALADARRALAMPFRCPDETPGYSDVRNVARLLSLEGYARADHGDIAGAIRSRLDIVQLGADAMPQGGGMNQFTVAVVAESIGRRPLAALAVRARSDEVRAAARRLEEIDRRRVPLADILDNDRWRMLWLTGQWFHRTTAFGAIGSGPFWTPVDYPDRLEMGPDSALRGRGALVNAAWTAFTAWTYPSLLVRSKTQILADMNGYMDGLWAMAARPYRPNDPGPPPPGDPLSQEALGQYPGWILRYRDNQMETRLVMTAFALRAYRLERARYPDSLDDLVRRGYLTAVPADPFDPSGAPLRYRRTDHGEYLLYSVGPDGKDDGGRPALRNGETARWIEKDTTGDFVFGANTFPD